ncbi:MAG: hypothetical protein ACR2NP_07165 [Pirellulaceae bacterium]
MDPAQGSCVLEIPSSDSACHLDFSEDGRRLAFCTMGGQISVSNAGNGEVHDAKGAEFPNDNR